MDKPIYRSSYIKHYFQCPKKYMLSTQHEQERTEAMRDGLLFEGYLFGFKNNDQEELEGRKKPATLEPLKKKAEYIKNLFNFEGESFKKIVIEMDDFILQGELDFAGKFTHPKKGRLTGIVDIKFTSSIEKIWNYKMSKADMFQSVMYPLLEMLESNQKELNFNEPLPFYYLVIENNNFEEPLWKLFPVIVTKQDLHWIWSRIKQIHNAKELGYPAKDDPENCIGIYPYSGVCKYLEWCKEGRDMITLGNEIIFASLDEI